MDALTAIAERRSIRNFTADPVAPEQEAALLEAIRWSQSWNNTQCWEAILVRDPGIKQELARTLGSNPATTAVAEAPLVIALAARGSVSGCAGGRPVTPRGDWAMFDLGVAAQNLGLAAHALGLGAVTVGFFDIAKVDSLLGLPEGVSTMVLVPIGVPAKRPKPPRRRPTDEFSHQEKYGL